MARVRTCRLANVANKELRTTCTCHCFTRNDQKERSELKLSSLIQCIDMNTVDIHDVTTLLQKWNHWIPISSIKKMTFDTVLDLPLDDDKLAAVEACAMNIDTVAFQQCKTTVDKSSIYRLSATASPLFVP